MDGGNNGKPYEQMDDLGGGGFKTPLFLEGHPYGNMMKYMELAGLVLVDWFLPCTAPGTLPKHGLPHS